MAYAACKLCMYTNNLSDDYWTVLLRVEGYLKSTNEYALRYVKYPPVLEEYSDVTFFPHTETCFAFLKFPRSPPHLYIGFKFFILEHFFSRSTLIIDITDSSFSIQMDSHFFFIQSLLAACKRDSYA